MNSAIDAPRDQPLIERAELTLALGRMLFRYGASTQRIIDSMELLHERLGGERLEVLVTYDAITVTACEEGRSCTRVDASRELAGVNIHGLGEIRRLLLEDAVDTCDAGRFRARLDAIATTPEWTPVWPWRCLAAGVVGAGFCAFNRGDAAAIGISALASTSIFAVRLELLRRRYTVYLATLGAVFLGGVVAAAIARLGWSTTPGIALVAPALFLVPGVAMVTGGIDITRNHNSIGLARIAHTLALTATIFLGLALSLPLLIDLPSSGTAPAPQMWAAPFIGGAWAALTAAGLALLNGGHRRAIWICAMGGAMARFLREAGADCGLDPAGATLLAAVAATVLAIRFGERRRMPSVVLAVMSCLPLIPGFFALVGARGLFQLSVHGAGMSWPEAASGFQMTLQAIFIASAIIIGIIFTVMFIERDTRRV